MNHYVNGNGYPLKVSTTPLSLGPDWTEIKFSDLIGRISYDIERDYSSDNIFIYQQNV